MKKKLIVILKVLVSGVMLYLILNRIDINKLAESLRQGEPIHMLGGVLMGVVFNLVKFKKWHILISANGLSHTFWDGAKSYMIGNAMGIVTPMRAGDLGRALYFDPDVRPKIVGFTIVDRMLDLIAVIIFCIAGGFILFNAGFGMFLTTAGAICLILVYNPMRLHTILSHLTGQGILSQKLSRVSQFLKLLDRNLLTSSLLLSFAAFLLIVVQFYFVISAFEETTLFRAFLATPLITLSALIPITFMGLGVREGLSIYLFSMLAVSSTTAFTTAFLCFLINNISISIIGIIYLWGIRIYHQQASPERIEKLRFIK